MFHLEHRRAQFSRVRIFPIQAIAHAVVFGYKFDIQMPPLVVKIHKINQFLLRILLLVSLLDQYSIFRHDII